MCDDALQKSAEPLPIAEDEHVVVDGDELSAAAWIQTVPKSIMPATKLPGIDEFIESRKEKEAKRPATAADLEDGTKYLRRIVDRNGNEALVDVYDVLHAFGVNDQAVGHAIKKLLCAGQRGKASRVNDLRGAIVAIQRAITIAEREEAGG